MLAFFSVCTGTCNKFSNYDNNVLFTYFLIWFFSVDKSMVLWVRYGIMGVSFSHVHDDKNHNNNNIVKNSNQQKQVVSFPAHPFYNLLSICCCPENNHVYL